MPHGRSVHHPSGHPLYTAPNSCHPTPWSTRSEWVLTDSDTTKAYHINLVREDSDVESALDFRELLNEDFKDRFFQVTWEEIYRWAACHTGRFETLCTYFEQKTLGLKKAFKTV